MSRYRPDDQRCVCYRGCAYQKNTHHVHHNHRPGPPKTIDYPLDLVDVSPPSRVLTARQVSGPTKVGWSYDVHADTLIVNIGSISGTRAVSVAAVGASTVNRREPAFTSSS